MKMRTLRKLRALAPRAVTRRGQTGVQPRRILDTGRRGFDFDVTDATMEPEPADAPEAVFDRVTGPWDRRRASVMPSACDEET